MDINVGDVVLIKPYSWYMDNLYYNKSEIFIVEKDIYFTEQMARYCGTNMVIESIIKDDEFGLFLSLTGDDDKFRWCEEMFEKVKKPKYKEGEFILLYEYESPVRVVEVSFAYNNFKYLVYIDDSEEWLDEDEICDLYKPIKRKRMKHREIDSIIWHLRNSVNKGDTKSSAGSLEDFILKIKDYIPDPIYPETIEECLKVEDVDRSVNLQMLADFRNLIHSRDVFWKIYGNTMGLDNPWKPDWKNGGELKYVIECVKNEIETGVRTTTNAILSFPTEELRDLFLDNFRCTIEKCKNLLN